MLKVNKGDKVMYHGNMPYILADGNQVKKDGDTVVIRSTINVQKKFFSIVEEPKKEVKVEEKVEKKEEIVVEKKESKSTPQKTTKKK